MAWTEELDERQRKELVFARLYAKEFSHGTDGHNRLLLIAKLADMIDDLHEYTTEILYEPVYDVIQDET